MAKKHATFFFLQPPAAAAAVADDERTAGRAAAACVAIVARVGGRRGKGAVCVCVCACVPSCSLQEQATPLWRALLKCCVVRVWRREGARREENREKWGLWKKNPKKNANTKIERKRKKSGSSEKRRSVKKKTSHPRVEENQNPSGRRLWKSRLRLQTQKYPKQVENWEACVLKEAPKTSSSHIHSFTHNTHNTAGDRRVLCWVDATRKSTRRPSACSVRGECRVRGWNQRGAFVNRREWWTLSRRDLCNRGESHQTGAGPLKEKKPR